MVDYFEGLLKIANVVLGLFAAYIAVTMFQISGKKRKFKPWQILIVSLVFFMIQEILGALRAFNIYSSDFLTHINTSIILLLLIYALAWQIHINLTEKK